MLSLRNTCDPDRLRLLAEDRLTLHELTELERHLEGCTSCRGQLDRLAGSDPWLGTVRHHLRESANDSDDPGAAAALSLALPGSIRLAGFAGATGIVRGQRRARQWGHGRGVQGI